MKANFKLQNICGTVYRQGNILFNSDGNSILSPVGIVSRCLTSSSSNKSFTFSFENRKNIAAISLSPDSNLLISVDEDGRALLVNFKRGVVLHHFNFKKPVKDVKFSPDGKFIAVTHGSHVQVWKTPNHLAREFAPFVLHRTYTGHHDDVLTIQWSPDSLCFISTSKDMTARLFTLNPLEGFRPKTFAGHKDAVVGAYFSADGTVIYTISRDDVYHIAHTRWGISKRNYFNQARTKVICTTFHQAVTTPCRRIFHLEYLDCGRCLRLAISTASASLKKKSPLWLSTPSGEWLAFGAKKIGQLLVWEWQSESYILKQQGHFFDMNTLAYASDGQTIATGGDDGKVKVWSATTGFCFVTFSEHTAPVSSVAFVKQGSVLFTASLDGTVRAYDLVRYRNFRTFTSPSPVQFSSLAVDPSGEVVAAGSTDSFEIYMWSVQTGKLLDVLTGHEGPVSSLDFSPAGANQLASGSWDGSVRVWNVFGRSRAVEPFTLNSDVLAVAFRPDGRELAASTLNGQIMLFNVEESKQTNTIEGRKDISGGRKADDRVSAANNSSGKSYNSLVYTADGHCILAGGNSKYVVLYDVREGEGVMVKKFQISENLSLDGTEEFLDSRKVNDAGINVDLIDTRGEESDLEDRLDMSLPGASRGAGDMSIRRYRQEARTKCIRFSPTGRAWAAASTEGLLIYSLDDNVTFDPFDLSMDLTPQSTLSVLESKQYLTALVMAFRLNEQPLIQKVFESIPSSDITLISRQLPTVYLEKTLHFVANHLRETPHLEFDLMWAKTLLVTHGRYLRERKGEYASVFRMLQKELGSSQAEIGALCDENTATLSYLLDQAQLKSQLPRLDAMVLG
ncbi:WD40-repeat-containing domain protein [Flagelloscypha sp. PMI_526]|nr:WD40-repeat-containing domain protein [Flagelloscypha sp. PMI_526]